MVQVTFKGFLRGNRNTEGCLGVKFRKIRCRRSRPGFFLKINLSIIGRTVHIEKKELPECLKRARPSGWTCDTLDGKFFFKKFGFCIRANKNVLWPVMSVRPTLCVFFLFNCRTDPQIQRGFLGSCNLNLTPATTSPD